MAKKTSSTTASDQSEAAASPVAASKLDLGLFGPEGAVGYLTARSLDGKLAQALTLLIDGADLGVVAESADGVVTLRIGPADQLSA